MRVDKLELVSVLHQLSCPGRARVELRESWRELARVYMRVFSKSLLAEFIKHTVIFYVNKLRFRFENWESLINFPDRLYCVYFRSWKPTTFPKMLLTHPISQDDFRISRRTRNHLTWRKSRQSPHDTDHVFRDASLQTSNGDFRVLLFEKDAGLGQNRLFEEISKMQWRTGDSEAYHASWACF